MLGGVITFLVFYYKYLKVGTYNSKIMKYNNLTQKKVGIKTGTLIGTKNKSRLIMIFTYI